MTFETAIESVVSRSFRGTAWSHNASPAILRQAAKTTDSLINSEPSMSFRSPGNVRKRSSIGYYLKRENIHLRKSRIFNDHITKVSTRVGQPATIRDNELRRLGVYESGSGHRRKRTRR